MRQKRDRINMTADEFLDGWTKLCDGIVRTPEDAGLAQLILVRVLKEFEARGSVTHRRQVLAPDMTAMYSSPDIRQ